eukprot:30013-Pelagococcus_subviridis.AAC.7
MSVGAGWANASCASMNASSSSSNASSSSRVARGSRRTFTAPRLRRCPRPQPWRAASPAPRSRYSTAPGRSGARSVNASRASRTRSTASR